MADEIVYRLIAGEGVQIVEDSGTKTATLSVPGLSTKLNQGDIGQASQVTAGIIEIATNAEVQTGTDADRAVTPAGLAAASQSTLIDATPTRLMRVGAFGLGSSAFALTAPNLNDERPTGFYYCTNPVNGPLADGWLMHEDFSVSGYAVQTFNNSAGRRFIRAQNAGSWSAWRELYHTGNFDPTGKANISGSYPGLDVGNSATVAGQTAIMLAPPGMVASFAMINAPTGWLKANGAAVSRTTYAALFAAIGTQWGAGNGSSTFNLPDLRGEFMRWLDDGRGLDSGRALGTVQGGQNLRHGHGISDPGHGHGISDPGHGHRMFDQSGSTGGNTSSGFNNERYVAVSISANQGGYRNTDPAGTGISISASGTGVSVAQDGGDEARPRNISLLPCIKF